MIHCLLENLAGRNPGGDDKAWHSGTGSLECFCKQRTGRNRSGDGQRRNMIKEPAMLIMSNDEQRTVPLCGVFGEYLIDIPKKVFSSPDSRGRMVVIGCPAKMDGRISVLWLDEYYLRHLRHLLGCHVSRE